MQDLRVLILADDPLVRAGLAALLAEQPGCAVIARASSVEDLSVLMDTYQPDVLLWDSGWNPTLALERLAEANAVTLPVALLVPDAQVAGEAWVAGVRALLPRDAEPPRIAAALVALAQGLAVIDPELAGGLLPLVQRPLPGAADSSESLIEELTTRELEVLRLLADGLSNKIIAQRLVISEHTVKFHVNAILGKLGVASRTEAVVRATRLGLILL